MGIRLGAVCGVCTAERAEVVGYVSGGESVAELGGGEDAGGGEQALWEWVGRAGGGGVYRERVEAGGFIGYEGLGQFPVRRRTETEAEFQKRKSLGQQLNMTAYSHELVDRLKGRWRVEGCHVRGVCGAGSCWCWGEHVDRWD